MSKRWSPYIDNGGKDYVVLAADTRMSQGYNIATRTAPKYCRLTDKCYIVTSGMAADMNTLHRLLQARITQYEHAHNKTISSPAIAQMLSVMLYYRRFFPYYTFNLLGGLDEEGRGAIWTYDAVGSFERVQYSAAGSGVGLVIPVLDNQVGKRNQENAPPGELTLEEAVDLLKDALTTAGERDIYTGDFVDIIKITAKGTEIEKFELKFD